MVANRDVRESLLGTGVAFTTSMLALGIATVVHLATSWSLAAIAATLVSIALVVVAARARARVAASTAIGVVCVLVPVLLVGCGWSLAQPLAMGARSGTGDFGLPFIAVLVGFLGSVLGLAVSLVVRRVPRVALPLGAAVVFAGAFVAGLGVRSTSKPDPDAYFRLFDRQRIDAGGSGALRSERFAYDATPRPAPLLGDRWCALHVGDEPVAVDAVLDPDTCPSIVVARDAKTGLVLVLGQDSRLIAAIGAISSYAPDVLYVDDFRGRLGAPRGWVLGALGGLVVALGALAMAIRMRRARDVEGALETTHTGQGWVTLDGVPRFVAQLATHPAGPVVVAMHDATRAPTYRDDGAAKIFKVIPGNLATLRAEARIRAAAWAFVAIASVAATSAPLWVARVFGLL
jgi:hypothetical protein